MTFTLAICCYNFERFIDEAIDGAFAQTYRPLEIVISDDHSPDRTWEKILAKVASYGYQVPDPSLVGSFRVFTDRLPEQFVAPVWSPTSPPQPPTSNLKPQTSNVKRQTSNLKPQTSNSNLTIVLNRNPQNLGLALHENKLFELASGDYIAFQSGDDISVPERVERIAAVVENNPRVRCLHCRSRVVDAIGNDLNVPIYFLNEQKRGKAKRGLPSILGAGAVYHRDVYFKFGPLGPRVGNEDHVLPFRAQILGDISFMEEKLVQYRKHGENASGTYSRDADAIARSRLRMIYMYYQELADLHFAESEGLVDHKYAKRYQKMIEEQIFIMRFGAHWHLCPRMRLSLVLGLLLSPRYMLLFLRRAVARLV